MLSIFLKHDLPSLGVDFQLPLGTLSAIVGPSGSGKTSVLRAVAGLLTTERSLVSFDKDIWAPSADQQAIDRRHDNELARLCQIMSRDDPRYKSADCDDRRPGGR